jgi:hypothetical protein
VEAILLDPGLSHLRGTVGKSTVFYSHAQRQDPLLDFWKLAHPRPHHARVLPEITKRFFWVDYFCLRQCVSDFDVPRTVQLIKRIGCLLADVDDHLEYLNRSFCVLEMFGAVAGNAKILMQTNFSQQEMEQAELKKRPIDVKNAKTRYQKDKRTVDQFIEGDRGFDKFNEAITEAVIKNANPHKGGRF